MKKQLHNVIGPAPSTRSQIRQDWQIIIEFGLNELQELIELTIQDLLRNLANPNLYGLRQSESRMLNLEVTKRRPYFGLRIILSKKA